MTVKTALLQGCRLLEEAGVGVPRLTAEVLLAHAIRCERPWLYAHGEDELREVWWIHYGRYLHERIEGKPTQYITRKQEFYGREFEVSPDVLIPRPETEHLVEQSLRRYTGGRVIDVGTGSGAIAATLRMETGAAVTATDISHAALAVARRNAESLGAQVEFVCCNMLDAIGSNSAALVASNPPYVPESDRTVLQREVVQHEPHVALFGGPDGFDAYRGLIRGAERALQPGGWLVMETAYNATGRLQEMLAAWRAVEVHCDLAGLPRVVAARRDE